MKAATPETVILLAAATLAAGCAAASPRKAVPWGDRACIDPRQADARIGAAHGARTVRKPGYRTKMAEVTYLTRDLRRRTRRGYWRLPGRRSHTDALGPLASDSAQASTLDINGANAGAYGGLQAHGPMPGS
jgi:hypothetical protein